MDKLNAFDLKNIITFIRSFRKFIILVHDEMIESQNLRFPFKNLEIFTV